MMLRICLDAGHGLFTSGKRCLKSLDATETREWVLNSRIATMVENELKNYLDVETIRLDDVTGKTDIPLSTRAKKANDKKVDILVSIHHDAGILGGSGGGTTVYRYPNSSKMTKAMQKALYDSLIKNTGLKGNRAKPLNEANFQILRESNMASVLIENGFMDSKVDVPIILSQKHAIRTAKGIVEFVVNHYRLRPRIKKDKTNEPTTRANELYKVQVGAYADKANADKKLAELKKQGHQAYIKKE